MPLNDIEKVELEMALNAVRMLAEYKAVTRISFEWKPGEHPTVTFVPVSVLDYISVEFTILNEAENG